MNAVTQNTWTSYRDGRRVMHYMRADGGRYFVQKVEAGYAVTFLADEGDGVSIRLSTEATLAAGKKWVADHLAAAPTKGSPALDAQKVGRVMRAYQLPAVGTTKIEHDRGQSFLANSARQLGLTSFARLGEAATDYADGHTLVPPIRMRDYQLPFVEEARAKLARGGTPLEYAFGAKDADPKTLEFKALRACAALEVISWDEAAPCGDMAVSQGLLTRWLPLCNPSAPSPAFPHGFVDTIYFPMRKGIRKIIIRRKSK